MPLAELAEDGTIAVATEYRDRDLIRRVPGTRWDDDNRVWRTALSWASCVQLRGVFDDRLQVGAELSSWAKRELDDRITPCLNWREQGDAQLPPEIGAELYPYQRAGVAFLTVAGSALLGDDMGLGKTLEIIRTLEYTDGYPALIVCPNSVRYTWQREFEKWAPHRKVLVIGGGADKRRKLLAEEADAYVINWEALMRHSRLAPYGNFRLTDEEKTPKELNEMPLRSVIADEAHRSKSPKAKQTRALWSIGHRAGIQHRFALTGTPIANSPEDLWSIMHFVAPEEWPSKTAFIDRYALSSWNAFGFNQIVGLKGENQEELFKILDPRFIRRPKDAVLSQLPPKVYTTREVEFHGKQARAYKQIEKQLLAELDEGVLLATNPLTRLTRLVQFASAYGELAEDGHTLTLSEPSCKLDALNDIVDELGPRQALVFAESRQLIELAAARLAKRDVSHGQITGAIRDTDRQTAVEAFQAGQLQFLLLTFGAGGEGLTLTAADTEVFLQRSWSQVKNAQAEDRAHRPGQEAEQVEIIDVITRGTIEDHVREVLQEKAEHLQEITRDEATLRRWLG